MLYFKLMLSFIGWFLLCLLTLGLGFIYVLPYWGACKVIFYKREICGAEGDFVSEDTQESDEDVQQVMYAKAAPEESEYVETIVVSNDNDQEQAVESVVEETPVVYDSQPAESVTVISVEEPTEPVTDTIVVEPQEQNVATVERAVPPASVKAVEEKHDAESEKNATKEAIRQRIEQLKRERNRHAERPQKPEPRLVRRPPAEDKRAEPKQAVKPSIAAKTNEQRTKKRSDEFGPEIIEVELVEDD